MKRDIYKISYIGTEQHNITELRKFYENRNDACTYLIDVISPTDDGIIDAVSQDIPSLVIYEIDSSRNDINILLLNLAFIKRHYILKRIPIVAIVNDKLDIDTIKLLLSTGVSYLHYSGTEFLNLLRNTFYIAFNKSPSFPKYNSVNNLTKHCKVSILANISTINENTFFLESDIAPPQDKIFNLSTNIINNNFFKNISIRKSSHSTYSFFFQSSYVCQLPIPSKFENRTENHIERDELRHWVSQNLDQVLNEQKRIKIITNNATSINVGTLLKEQNSESIILSFHSKKTLNPDSIVFNCPEVIILEMEPSKEEETYEEIIDLDYLSSLITLVAKNQSDYSPIFIIFNSPSTTQALQKIFKYNKILALPHNISINLLNRIIKTYLSHENNSLGHKFFKVSSSLRLANINFDIEVNFISESQLNFSCSYMLPLFSIVSSNCPVNMLVMIIETEYSSSDTGKHKYKGIIMGIKEQDITTLRVFVNTLINTPETEFIPFSKQDLYFKEVPLINQQEKEKTKEVEVEEHVVQAHRPSGKNNKL